MGDARISERERCTDRWPAWLVASYVCITVGLHNGILNCGALFYPALMDTLGHPISVVSWLVTGQYAMTYCLSPFYNRLIDYIPNRIAITSAVLLTTGSLIASAMVSNFWAFLVLYTVVGGFGMGISVVRAMAIAADYFDRYRILALALCSSGSGLGTLVYSKIGAHMIDTYTWRIALIGYALLHLHMIILGLLLKPLPAEPVPAPTVLIPDQPDLNACDLPADVLDRKIESGQNLFLSILSVNSVQANLPGARVQSRQSIRTELVQRNTITSDLRVIIEFVKATRSSGPQPLIYLDPISFLPDPGVRVMRQLEDAAQEALLEDGCSTDHIMIPILFVVSNFDVMQVDTRDPVTGSQLKMFLDSRFDLMGTTEQPEDTIPPTPQRRIPVGDSFASSVAVMQDRRQIRQAIRAVINNGQLKVTEVAAQLNNRGLSVYPTPIMVLVDQNEEVGKATNALGSSGDQTHVWGNYGMENYVIPEEVEPTDQFVNETDEATETLTEQQLTTDRATNVDKDRPRILRRISQAPASQIFSSVHSIGMGRPRRTGSTMRGFESVLIQSGTELDKSRRQSRDLFASVVSMKTANEAVSMLTTKYREEMKQDLLADATAAEQRKSRKFLLTDMLFLTFLLTRTLVFIADSIVFAHLTNFAIISGFDPEASAGLLSFIGIANMVGRMGTGVIGQFARGLELRSLTAGCLLMLAVYTILMPLYPSYIALAIYAVAYGILVSPSFAFAPSIAYDVVGPSRYDEAVAFVYQFEASGFLVGGPIGGAIKEINNNYFECFAFAGFSNLVAAIILFIQGIILSDVLRKIVRLTRHATGMSAA